MTSKVEVNSMAKAVAPFSLKDAPSLIERVWPAQKLSVETQKERKAVQGQTITALGTYWKGRKPLILVRACILASLMPATEDVAADLEIFDLLMGLDDSQVAARLKQKLLLSEIVSFGSQAQKDALLSKIDNNYSEKKPIDKLLRKDLSASVVARMPYSTRVEKLIRPEEVSEVDLIQPYMPKINLHLGTSATSFAEVIRQLGTMRFGHAPRVGDTFAGGGSIPFEAARTGCDVYAADLNPIACMLTWGAINIVGSTEPTRVRVRAAQKRVVRYVEEVISALGVEADRDGNRTKAHLYCLEVTCPKTGWRVPLLPSRVISPLRKTILYLVPDHANKRFDIQVINDASQKDIENAAVGTLSNGNLSYSLNGEEITVSLKSIRGERRQHGKTVNNLRRWLKLDSAPIAGDIFQERLYCVQWITKDSLNKGRQDTFFTGVTQDDLDREEKVSSIVNSSLKDWQLQGLVPDMPIESGEKTDEPIRTRGWTYWHHLFNQRQILIFATAHAEIRRLPDFERSVLLICFAKALDWGNKGCRFGTGAARESISNLFSNQALNTLYNFGCRSSGGLMSHIDLEFSEAANIAFEGEVKSQAANNVQQTSDIFITDPPYADAVNYHEITEFFIAWLRRDPPKLFSDWIWDSRRPLAIKGDGEEFRHAMVEAYRSMTEHMPDNGLQIVMFTHQSGSVWADMAQIFWGAGLQVMAAWYIATETTSELKKGGYVQGTVILVLRKRKANETGYKDEIVQEVRAEVADQIDTMMGLNQTLKGSGRIESLFEDSDLQMAGYAAALRVLTRYQRIDGTDMTKEALRQRRPGEKNLVGEVIEFAVQVANEHMVPEHMPPKVWERLTGSERFYFKMMDIETTSLRKLDNYQNFAKAFRVGDYATLMGGMEPNKASLKTARQFKKAIIDSSEFGASATRAALYGIFELENDVEGDDVLIHLRDLLPTTYHSKREELLAIADYIARKRTGVDEPEARSARILFDLIRNERLG